MHQMILALLYKPSKTSFLFILVISEAVQPQTLNEIAWKAKQLKMIS